MASAEAVRLNLESKDSEALRLDLKGILSEHNNDLKGKAKRRSEMIGEILDEREKIA